jgi:hypothetical protein
VPFVWRYNYGVRLEGKFKRLIKLPCEDVSFESAERTCVIRSIKPIAVRHRSSWRLGPGTTTSNSSPRRCLEWERPSLAWP